MLQILELLRDESLAVCQGLLSDIRFGNEVVVGLADLDVITKDLIVADFEALDARLFLLARLNLGNNALAAGEDMAQTVDLAVITVADESTLAHGERRLVHDRLAQKLVDILQRIKPRTQIAEKSRGKRRERFFQMRQLLQ